MKITFLFIFLSIFLISCASQTNNEALAQCLGEKDVTMFGTEWCRHCQNQKAEFGGSFQYIKFIDCDENAALCLSEGIEGYPTWKINDRLYPGEQKMEFLAGITGCPLE